MGNYSSVPSVPNATIKCEQFEPGMFVSIIIDINSIVEIEREFKVNFLHSNQSGNNSDHILEVYADFNKSILVLDSLGHKETPHSVPVNIEKRRYYQLTIAAEVNSFDIYVEKEKYYSYQYRDDVRKVNKIEYSGCMGFLSIGKCLQGLTSSTAKVIYIEGTAPPSGRFAIDLVDSFQPSFLLDNIPFHMSVRFEAQVVVRNAKLNREWIHNEEKEGGIPFQTGKDFSVTIFAQRETFEIAVDSNHFTKFKYRPGTFNGKEMSVQLRNVPFVKKISYH